MEAMSDIDVVVLCGGKGERLRSVIGEAPKVMTEINGQPFLNYILEYLKSQKVGRVILCTGYKAEVIEKYYRKHSFGLVIDFAREHKPLGTAGAIKHAEPVINGNPVIVLNGDCYCPVDFKKFIQFHKRNKALATLVVTRMAQGSDYGEVVLDNNKRIIGFREKRAGAKHVFVNTGIYCFDRTVLAKIPPSKKASLEYDCFPQWIGQRFWGFPVESGFLDMGTPERLKAASDLLSHICGGVL